MADPKFPEYNNALRAPGPFSAAGDMLMTPLNVGAFHAARSGDFIANMIAEIMGKQRQNPNEQTDKTMPNLARSFDAMSAVKRDVGGALSAIPDWLGWKDKQPSQVQAPVPRPIPMATPTVTWEAGQQTPQAPQTAQIPVPQGALPGNTPEIAPTSAVSTPAEIPVESPADPRRSIADLFKERLASVQKPDAAVTQEQKKAALLEASLAMLQASSKPGANALGAFGEAGQRGTALMRQQEQNNKATSDKDYTQKLDMLAKEMGFINLDEDNKRADKQASSQEKRFDEIVRHNKASEALQQKARELQLQRDQGKITNQQYLIELQRERMALQQEKGDPLVRTLKELQGLYREQGQDKTIEELMHEVKGVPKGDAGERDVLAIAKDIMKNDISGTMTPQKAATQARELMAAARGNSAADSKPDPVANKGRTIAGPDGKFKSDGKTWVKVQ